MSDRGWVKELSEAHAWPEAIPDTLFGDLVQQEAVHLLPAAKYGGGLKASPAGCRHKTGQH